MLHPVQSPSSLRCLCLQAVPDDEDCRTPVSMRTTAVKFNAEFLCSSLSGFSHPSCARKRRNFSPFLPSFHLRRAPAYLQPPEFLSSLLISLLWLLNYVLLLKASNLLRSDSLQSPFYVEIRCPFLDPDYKPLPTIPFLIATAIPGSFFPPFAQDQHFVCIGKISVCLIATVSPLALSLLHANATPAIKPHPHHLSKTLVVTKQVWFPSPCPWSCELRRRRSRQGCTVQRAIVLRSDHVQARGSLSYLIHSNIQPVSKPRSRRFSYPMNLSTATNDPSTGTVERKRI